MVSFKQNLFELLVNISQVGLYVLQNRRFKFVNDGMTKITGYSKDELMGIEPDELIFPEEKEIVNKKVANCLKEGKETLCEFRIRTKHGDIKWIFVNLFPSLLDKKPSIMGNIIDITRQKQIEKELRDTKDVLENTLSAVPMGIVLGENRIIKWANNEMSKIFGYSLDELIDMDVKRIYASKEEYERVGNLVYDILKNKKTAEIEASFRKKDGSLFWGLIRMSAFEPGTKKVIAAITDITWRKEAEKKLFKENELLNTTLRSIGDGVICTDKKGNITMMNMVAEELTGWKEKEAIGRPITEVFHIINEITRERVEDPVEKVLKTGKIIGLANHTVLISKDGKEKYLADSGAPIRDKEGNINGVVLVFRDVTEKRKFRMELQRIEKLESIGTLAGGIAHDFNNMLMGVIGNISLAKIDIGIDNDAYKRLEDAERILLQAKNLAQQLLTFSKGGAPIKKPTHLKKLIKDTTKFSLSGSNVSCVFDITDDLWPTEVDEAQIGQVINNIVINSQQAMPSGGKIKIKAENVLIGKDDYLPVKEGKYVKISIEDTGIGIPKEYIDKIFEPYFTTKQKGSGLGLAVAYSIIKNHDGYIKVESGFGKGARFDIYLPAYAKDIPEKKKESITGKKRILVMDDEELVLDVIKEMLKILGHKVEVAKDGEKAIELYKKAKDKGKAFDAVILDITVPAGMGGKETLEKLMEIDPDVKAIVSSGYSNDPIMSEYKKYGFKAVVAKPYGINELSEVLSEVFKS